MRSPATAGLFLLGRLSDTDAADAKCETKFRDGWGKTRSKAQDKDASLGADCDGAMSNAVRDSVEASALIAVGRDLTLFAVSDSDLADDSGVQSLIDEAVGNACTPEPTPEPYDCFLAATCSAIATIHEDLAHEEWNDYVGDQQGVGDAAGCGSSNWDEWADYINNDLNNYARNLNTNGMWRQLFAEQVFSGGLGESNSRLCQWGPNRPIAPRPSRTCGLFEKRRRIQSVSKRRVRPAHEADWARRLCVCKVQQTLRELPV